MKRYQPDLRQEQMGTNLDDRKGGKVLRELIRKELYQYETRIIGRYGLLWSTIWRPARSARRSGLQYRNGWICRDPHGSILPGTDSCNDVPATGQLRRSGGSVRELTDPDPSLDRSQTLSWPIPSRLATQPRGLAKESRDTCDRECRYSKFDPSSSKAWNDHRRA